MPFDDSLTSSLNLDDDADDFYSVYGANARRGGNSLGGGSGATFVHGVASDLESSICSGVSGATAASSAWDRASSTATTATTCKSGGSGGGAQKRSGGVGVIDPALLRGASSASAESTIFRFRASVLTLLLTHETPSSASGLTSSSSTVVECLARMAEGYFDALGGVNCARDVETLASELTAACVRVGGGDHLRLTLKPLTLSVTEKATPKNNVVCRSVDATIGGLDLVECLFEESTVRGGSKIEVEGWGRIDNVDLRISYI